MSASQDSSAMERSDRNRQMDKQCDNDLESGVRTCGDVPFSRTRPVGDNWEHFHEDSTSPTPVISDFCFGELVDELTLKHYITSIHNAASNIVILDVVSLKCTKCNYEAISREDLQNHSTMLHDEDKKFSCDLCGCSFFTDCKLKTHLKAHTKKKVDTIKPNGIKNDYKTTVSPSYSKVHLRRHTGKKRFHCDVCDYKCSSKCILNRHNRTHTGEKPFHCHLCDHKSFRKSHLIVHIMTHTGDKPFHCNLCNFKSIHKCSLTRHIKTHTAKKREKKFHCNLCDFKSVSKSYLTQHTRTHHGEETLLCNIANSGQHTKVN